MDREELQPNDWTCPGCSKHHYEPHWKDHRQKKVKLGQSSFGTTEDSNEKYRYSKDGTPAALYCPHCGWEEKDRVVLVKA